ncbi:Cytochrome b561/ferric reductase transmembrane protein family, putative isoform 2 [Theobroma cacao]|uniref:Cytochrome b561/ferric reductase transmembrane protein family, putative isoform 2 n=1 Tax=Theobroma cacao TaxID=3641 RepID=A0A061EA97_THECC|nr:Cytochrome b561/ferric reductase transmembrane protein family, putative isoform 2 [Theobroma cacao]
MPSTQEVTYGVHRRSASRLTIVAHMFGILAFVLMLVWLLHYRGGIEYDSYDGYRVFNVHPFLMFCGFIFLSGEAMMVYKTVQAIHIVQKVVHMILQLTAFVLGVVGLCAVFKFHDMASIEDVYSLHSWIGIGTISLFALQDIAIHVDSCSSHWLDGEGYLPQPAPWPRNSFDQFHRTIYPLVWHICRSQRCSCPLCLIIYELF